MNELKKLEIYTDGACRGNPGLGAWAYQYKSINGNIIKDSSVVKNTTNNCMELTAILKCLNEVIFHELNYIDQITIYSDSKYSIDVITKWSNNWNDDEFYTRPNGKLIKDIRLLRSRLFESGIKVIFVHVKGHSGIEGNESVDKMCNLSMDKFNQSNSSEVNKLGSDDERMITLLSKFLEDARDCIDHKDEINNCLNWLKELKNRL